MFNTHNFKKYSLLASLFLGLTSPIFSKALPDYVDIDKPIENKNLDYFFKVQSNVVFDSAVPDTIEKFYNPGGIRKKNEYKRCVNRLSDYIKIGPLQVSETKYRYCKCVAQEITLFKRIKDVVFNEAKHCMKLL